MEFAEQKGKIDKKVLDEILNFIQRINYGEVVITIHDSKAWVQATNATP